MKKESVSNLVGTNALYGRARRIEFVERVTYVVIAIIAIIIVFVIVGKNSSYNDRNINFAFLRDYLEERGYHCDLIHRVGGSCTLTSDYGLSSFTRYEDGFNYVVKSEAYHLDITFSSEKGDSITFKTTAYALSGYRNKNYTCYYKDSVVGEFDYCTSEDEEKLDSKVYVGVIEKAMYDLNNIVENSGYRRDKLLDEHQWVKR